MILVTGAAGFIGSNLVQGLNDLGIEDIILCDQLNTSSKWQNLNSLSFLDYVESSDLFNFLKTSNQKISCIFHLGACSDTLENDMQFLIRNNYEYSKLLAEYSFKSECRFIYASSAATYGMGENGFVDDHQLIPKLKPLNKYGFSKQIFDLWLLRNGHLGKCVGLKYFNIFGPNEQHKGNMRSLILKAYEQIKQTGSISLFKSNNENYKNGEQLRDFLYVKDAVNMTLHFMNSNDYNGIFNIGSGTAETWNSLAKALFSAMDISENIKYIDMPESISKQYQNYTCANMDKLKQTGYEKPITNLKDAVSDYARNHLDKV